MIFVQRTKPPPLSEPNHVGPATFPMNAEDKRVRIREARLEYAMVQRIKARRLRATKEGHPRDHLQEDKDFLKSLYRNMGRYQQEQQSKHKTEPETPPQDRRIHTRKEYAIQQRLQARKLRAEMEKYPQGRSMGGRRVSVSTGYVHGRGGMSVSTGYVHGRAC